MALQEHSVSSRLLRKRTAGLAVPVSGKKRPVPGAAKVGEFEQACRNALRWSRSELLALAIDRGCAHYASLWPRFPAPTGVLPHEVLGCALLRGPEDAETFQAIRCGAMVLSDWNNDPELVAEAAVRLAVSGRVSHVAKLGLRYDTRPDYWRAVIEVLPEECTEEDFLPGVSRLTRETFGSSPRHGVIRGWLRSDFAR